MLASRPLGGRVLASRPLVLATLNFWWSVTQAPPWLVAGLAMLALASVDTWR
jgi:hypothetical protein